MSGDKVSGDNELRGNNGVLIKILTQGRFSIAKGRAKSIVLTSCLSPEDGVYNQALKTEVIIPALPSRWGSRGNK